MLEMDIVIVILLMNITQKGVVGMEEIVMSSTPTDLIGRLQLFETEMTIMFIFNNMITVQLRRKNTATIITNI